MRKILITGGSGFIGTHFHQAIPNENLVNLDLAVPKFQHSATFFQGDIRVNTDVKKVIEQTGVSTILSLAAKHHDFGIGHAEYFDTNEGGTQVLCQVASEHGIKRIVFYSTVAVYGQNEKISSEETTPQPESPYGASKLAGENVLKKWAAQDSSRQVLIIRPAVVFGPHNIANMLKLIKQIDSGLYFHVGRADNVKSIAYVENLVDATLYLMQRMTTGVQVFNYADEPQLTSREIGEEIARELKKKIRMTIPRGLAIVMGIPFDVLIKLTGLNLPVSTARIKKLSTQTLHSAQKIFSTGFTPRFSTRNGLAKMVQWYQEEKSP